MGHARNANVRPARADCQATHANVAQAVGTVVNRDHRREWPRKGVLTRTGTRTGAVAGPSASASGRCQLGLNSGLVRKSWTYGRVHEP